MSIVSSAPASAKPWQNPRTWLSPSTSNPLFAQKETALCGDRTYGNGGRWLNRAHRQDNAGRTSRRMRECVSSDSHSVERAYCISSNRGFHFLRYAVARPSVPIFGILSTAQPSASRSIVSVRFRWQARALNSEVTPRPELLVQGLDGNPVEGSSVGGTRD